MESIKRAFPYESTFQPWISTNMAIYRNQEKAEMDFMYGLANGNALKATIL